MNYSAPKLDPECLNHIDTAGGSVVNIWYIPEIELWQVEAGIGPGIHFYTMDGIDADEWPEVWSDIMETEQEEWTTPKT